MPTSESEAMDLYVRDTGPREAPAIVFLHGAQAGGSSWEQVLREMQGYRCLVPDLPHYGRSSQRGAFEIQSAAHAVAEIVRAHAGQAHLVGFSLGAQVGAQLLATEPAVIDRAVLCGTSLNMLPGVPIMQLALAAFVRSAWGQQMIKRNWSRRHPTNRAAARDDCIEDGRGISGTRLAGVAVASVGFSLPGGLEGSNVPTLCLAGSKELGFARHWTVAVARAIPDGVAAMAVGMRHDWPLHRPELFARTIDSWFSQSALPAEIKLVSVGR